jgi:hypothetical protein
MPGEKRPKKEKKVEEFELEERREEDKVPEEERRRDQERREEYFGRTRLEIHDIAQIEKRVAGLEKELQETESQFDAIDTALDNRFNDVKFINGVTVAMPVEVRKFYTDRINKAYDTLQSVRESGNKSLKQKFMEWGNVVAAMVGAGTGIGSLIATFVIADRSAKNTAKQKALMELLQDELGLSPQEAGVIKNLADQLLNMKPSDFSNAVALDVVALKWSWASQYALVNIIGVDIPTYETATGPVAYAAKDVLALESYVTGAFNRTGKYQTIWMELHQWLLGNRTGDAVVDAMPGDKSKLTLRQFMFLVDGIFSSLRAQWRNNPETLPTNPSDPVGV